MNDDAFIRFMNDYRDYFRTLDSYEEAYYEYYAWKHGDASGDGGGSDEYYAWKHRSLDKDVHDLALNYQASEQRTPTDIHQLILNLEG